MEATLTTISAADLKQKLQNDEPPVVINTLGEDAYTAQRIPGSINIPTGKIDEWAEQVIPDHSQDIVVYCANEDCTASPKAAQKLEELGYENVADFEAGYAGWRQAGYSLIGQEV